MSASESSSALHQEELTEIHGEVVQYFSGLCNALGLPKSIGEIFGLFFMSPEPLCFEDVVTKLGISKGSASQGIRLLQKTGALHTKFVPRDRRTFYVPETSVRRLVGGLLNETVRPHLEAGNNHLTRIERITKDKKRDLDPVIQGRLSKLRNWHGKAKRLIPWIARFAGSDTSSRADDFDFIPPDEMSDNFDELEFGDEEETQK